MGAVEGGPNVIYNGLVLYLDAANTKSYVSGSTTWTDLSRRNINGTLTNGPVFSSGSGGNIIFDGTNDYISLLSSGLNVGVYFTLQTWVNIGRFGGGPAWNRASIVTNSYPYATNQGFWVCCTSQGVGTAPTSGYERFFISIGADQYVATSSTGSLTNYVGKWVNLAVRVSGSTAIKLYINGVEPLYDYQTNGPSSIGYSTGPFALGSRNNQFEFTSASIAQFSMYNTALSATEILQNYNSTKTRFGL